MNITLFGAGGRIGKIIMSRALENGDTVTAYVRRGESLEETHGNLIVMVGELSNRLLIDKAVENADVVISALGPSPDAARRLRETPIAGGHEIIMHSMEKQDKKRFITLATPTVRSDEDRIRFCTVFARVMALLLFPNGYREMKGIGQLIRKSSLEWTVVRIIYPIAKYDKKKEYGVSLGDTPVKIRVSRENVGAFMYRVATEGSYIRKMPIVFNR